MYNPNQQCVRYVVEFTLPKDKTKAVTQMVIDDDIQADETTEGLGNIHLEYFKHSQTNCYIIEYICLTGYLANLHIHCMYIIAVEISDIQDVLDPMEKVAAGLVSNSEAPVPLKSVHVRANLLDLAAQASVIKRIMLWLYLEPAWVTCNCFMSVTDLISPLTCR